MALLILRISRAGVTQLGAFSTSARGNRWRFSLTRRVIVHIRPKRSSVRQGGLTAGFKGVYQPKLPLTTVSKTCTTRESGLVGR